MFRSKRHQTSILFLVFALAALLVPATVSAAPGAASGDGVVPVEEPSNPTCPAGLIELKADNEPDDQTLSDGTLTVVLDFHNGGSGELVDWSSNIGVDRVIVKGGPNGNAFVYTPEDKADTNLHAPINPSNGKYYDISHVSFCYDIELEVTKTAKTTFSREYDWTIKKSNDTTGTVKLAPGQTFEVNYEVTAEVEKYADSGWAVEGQITVKNPAGVTANGVNVTDVIEKAGSSDIAVSVDCNGETAGSGLPASISAGGTLICAYSSPLPDASSRTNKATATSTTKGIAPGSGTAAITFGAPTSEVDECVDVSDNKVDLNPAAELGKVCASGSPKTFTYSKTFGPYKNVCASYEYTNKASFVTNDTGATGEATSTVEVEVECTGEGGCSLTQGYWKTHSELGPAPYDDTWALLPGGLGAKTPFFNSGKTWYEAFWTPPAGGNAYWSLAHQYQAAVLNGLNGASVPAPVALAMTEAEVFLKDFAKYGSDPKKVKKADREAMVKLAGILAAYNEGTTGPGHCSEDSTSSIAP